MIGIETMSKTCFAVGIKNRNKEEWEGKIPCKWPTSKKILDKQHIGEDYRLSIIIYYMIYN